MVQDTKECTRCHLIKPVAEFKKRKNYWQKKDGQVTTKEWFVSWCNDCNKEYFRKQYKAEYYKKNKQRWKQGRDEFFEMYGKKCECCQETIKEFLTMEHKLGQIGIKNKDSSTKAYRKAIQEYRPDLYSVLCHNCNHTMGRLGYCPHHPERKVEYVPPHQR